MKFLKNIQLVGGIKPLKLLHCLFHYDIIDNLGGLVIASYECRFCKANYLKKYRHRIRNTNKTIKRLVEQVISTRPSSK